MVSPFRSSSLQNLTSRENLVNALGNPFGEHKRSSYSFIYGVVLLMLSLITALFNGIVIAVILKDPLKNLRKFPSSYLVLCLASVDFVVGSVQELLNGVWLTHFALHGYYPFNVSVVFSLRAMLLTASMTALLALGCDRMISVRSPLLYKSKVTTNRVKIAVVSVWAHGLLHGVIYGNLFKDHFITINMIFLAHVLFSFVVLAINYTILVVSYLKHSSSVRKLSKSEPTARSLVQRDRTVTGTVFVVLAAFKISFLPWVFSFLLLSACNTCNTTLLNSAFSLTSSLMYLNSLINPFLYAYCLPKYRVAIKHFLNLQQNSGKITFVKSSSTRLKNTDRQLSLKASTLFQRKNSANSTSSKSTMIREQRKSQTEK